MSKKYGFREIDLSEQRHVEHLKNVPREKQIVVFGVTDPYTTNIYNIKFIVYRYYF